MSQLLRLPEVMKRVGLGRSSIYRLVDSGRFPRPIQLGERARAWPSDEIENWIKTKRAERDQQAA